MGELPPGGARTEILRQLEHGDADAQRTAHRVVDLDLKVPALLRQQACHIIGAGEAP